MLESAEKYIAQEWAILASAPVSFLMAILVVGIAVWSFARWNYTERMDTLNNRLSARADEVEALKAKLAEAQAAPTKPPLSDPDDMTQSDRIVGKIIAPDIRKGDAVVLAHSITTSGDFDQQKPFVFRDMRLMLRHCDAETKATMSGMTRRSFHRAVCEILD
ncbi:hypothetical protein [Paracoccus yeei]|uniref:hypothetical protein n=1 Tax=Paracoccus yeei TaxID=147645 RepID=UPI0017481081|nr:hypothetical protein [Paracoccus yeei]